MRGAFDQPLERSKDENGNEQRHSKGNDETIALTSARVGTTFCNRLFEIASEVRPLFRGDLAERRQKLMTIRFAVVGTRDKLDTVLPAMRALAKRHVSFGVQAAHDPVVGGALLRTLERNLGSLWAPEIASAWSAANAKLAHDMASEAYGRPYSIE